MKEIEVIMKTKKNNFLLAVILIVVTELIGMSSSLIAGDIKGKYIAMVKAPLSPNPVIFSIVWPALYLLMALALYFILTNPSVPKPQKKFFVILYVIQLILNFIWSPLFFGNGLLWIALIVIVVMIIELIITIINYRKYSKLSAWLVTPYLLWLLFATYLTIVFAILN